MRLERNALAAAPSSWTDHNLQAKFKVKNVGTIRRLLSAWGQNRPAPIIRMKKKAKTGREIASLDRRRRMMVCLSTKETGAWKIILLHLLLSGRDETIDAMAQRLGINRDILSAQMRLTYLAPDIVRALIAGPPADGLTLAGLLSRCKGLPHDWQVQRGFLGFETR